MRVVVVSSICIDIDLVNILKFSVSILICYTLAMKEICAGKTTRGVCNRAAGWGTKHFGVGRCKRHDITGRTLESLPPTPTIKSLAEKYLRDREPFELREEIALCRAALTKIAESIDQEKTDLIRSIPALNALSNTIGRLVQRLHEIEEGRKYVVRVDQVQQSLQKVLALVIEFVPSPYDRAKLAESIATLQIGDGSSPDIMPTSLTKRESQTVDLLKSEELS